MKKVLLLTGCVNPKGMTLTALNDVGTRKQQYVEAVTWYLENTSYDVVFVENTEFDMSPFFSKEMKSGRLEYLTFDGNNFDKSLGKGYGETLILKYAFEKSKLLLSADLIVKITGRLVVRNINSILRFCKEKNCLYYKEFYQKRILYTSYFFVAPRSLYEELVVRNSRLNDSNGYYFEHLLCDVARYWACCENKKKELFFPIVVEGVSGSTGKAYSSGLFFGVKSYIKFFAHLLGFHRF